MGVTHRLYAEKLGATQVGEFIGNAGEIFYDPATLTLRISDGITPGGRLLVGGAPAGPTAADIAFTPTGNIATATVQAAIVELDNKKLALSGGTMLGPLVLSGGAPTSNDEAISKGYLDTYVGSIISTGIDSNNILYTPDANSTLTATNVQDAITELDATKLSLTGGVITGEILVTNVTPTSNNALVSKAYVDSIINTEDTYIDTAGFNISTGMVSLVNTDGAVINYTMDGRYLPFTGGTLTGPLTLTNPGTGPNDAATISYVTSAISSGSTANNITFVSNNSLLSSNNVTAALNELALEKVDKSGDIMTGLLVLSGDPVDLLGAATKQYVDNKIATGINPDTISFTSNNSLLSATTVSNALNELALEKVDRAGDTMTGFLTLYADPVAGLQAATKQYVDNKVTAGAGAKVLDDLLDVSAPAPVDGRVLAWDASVSLYQLVDRVKNTGDSMTGFLTLNADPTSSLHAVTKQYVDNKLTTGLSSDVIAFVSNNSTLSSVTVQGALNELAAEKVNRAGDTMAGSLFLMADPTSALEAATKQYVDTKVTAVVNSAPSTLDTLSELAAALGNDANFATTVTTTIGNKVSKAGDVMTGFLSLNANPTANMHAATKQYVDSSIATVVSGGVTATNIVFTPTGNISSTTVGGAIAELDTEKVSKAGDTMTGALILSGNPTQALQAATKQYVDAVSSAEKHVVSGSMNGDGGLTLTMNDASTVSINVGSDFVNKSGDIMTGALTLFGNPTMNLHAATKQYVDNKSYTLDSLSDVASSTATNGQVLAFNGTSWVPYTLPPGATDTYVSSASMNGSGVLTLTKNDSSTVIVNLATDFVKKVGDTMSGLLTLSADPTSNLHAATKQYVDNKSYAINSLSDVDTATTAPTANQVLSWNGTNWVPKTPSSGMPTGTADYQVPMYSTSTSSWSVAAGDALLYWYAPASSATGTESISAWTPNMRIGSVYYATDLQKIRLKTSNAMSAGGWVTVGAGDVAGPASSTDNAIARFDGTTGKLIQNSTATIDDNGNASVNTLYTTSGIFNGKSYTQGFVNNTTGSFDFSTSAYHKVTVSSAMSFSFTPPAIGGNVVGSMTIEIAMNGGSITWPASVKWPGGTAPTLTNSKTHLIMLTTSNAGSTYLASSLKDY